MKDKKDKKNPIFEKDIKDPIKAQLYNDNQDPERPKKAKNPPFMQLYKGVSFDFLKEQMKINPRAMNVWWELVGLMDNQGSVMISQQALAVFFGKSRQTVNTWINWLEKNELISIFKVGTANVYAINTDIISDQLITHKQQFALFNARVIAEKSEQTAKIKKKFFAVADSKIDPNQTSLLDEDQQNANAQ